jgi:hypothetical protein
MKILIASLILISACSSTNPREIQFSEEAVKQVNAVPSTDIAKCQITCFRSAHKGISNVSAVQLFNYLDLSKFTTELQNCNFGCFRIRNEWDDLQNQLTKAASN